MSNEPNQTMGFGRHVPVTVGATSNLRYIGTQWKFRFKNGFGASVINDGYGREQGLYELAVLHKGQITYDTPITDDVLGFLTPEQVVEALDKIEALPR